LIEYNYLKKPNKVVQNGVTTLYQYNANGIKLKETIGTQVTDYLGNVIYKNNILYQIAHDEGRIVNGIYEYDIKDHLGSLRVSFKDSSGIVKITQANSYGVWGEDLPTLSYQNTTNLDKFKFTGKEELQGTGYVDFGARWYDPIVPRFTTIDPLAEKMRRWSPYCYAFDNPLRFIDPDGMEPQDPQAPKTPPTRKDIIEEGRKTSSTFTNLLSSANVTDKNSKKVISFGTSGTYTDNATGNIVLTKSGNVKLQVIKLTHELTNRENKSKLIANDVAVSSGSINPKQYAQNAANIEIAGQINQLKVASEIGFRYEEKGSGGVNALIDRYSKDNTIDLTKYAAPGTEHLNFYESQGKKLREYYLKKHPQKE
jgi:RHS repeat-associated protein